MSVNNKNKINYTYTIIYRLICNDINVIETFVDQTTEFTKTENKHKSMYYNPQCKTYNCNLYKFIRENGGFKNWSMVQVENFNALSK